MLSLIYIVLFTFLQAWIDSTHLNKNEYIDDHTSRWVLRALFVIACSSNWAEFFGMTLVFTALFDGLLNVMRDKDVFYLGSVAYWDLFWKKMPYLYVIMKVISLFVGLLLCLI